MNDNASLVVGVLAIVFVCTVTIGSGLQFGIGGGFIGLGLCAFALLCAVLYIAKC